MPKHNAKGRMRVERLVRIHESMMSTEAWQALTCYSRCLLIELMRRFRGVEYNNNGRIGLGECTAAEALRIHRKAARKAFAELQDKGFVIMRSKCSFSQKTRDATEWEVTIYSLPGMTIPKNWFRKWRPGTLIDPETGEPKPAP